jgi:hypothetical protein
MAEPTPPVVTIFENTIGGGPAVRWHRTLDDARQMRAVVVASRQGVSIPGYLTDVPDEWVSAARAAHRAIRDSADVSHLATHRSRFEGGGGPLDPVA